MWDVMNDHVAETLLKAVISEWRDDGPLGELEGIVQDVWRTNVARHEPDLGDDGISLGLQSARNICNRAVDELRGMPGVLVRGGLTLEIRFAGRMLHVGKATPEPSRTWSVWSVDWESSDVRDDAARANWACYQPLSGTLLETLTPLPGLDVDVEALRYLHLAWQGFVDDAHCRAWLGFPSAGPQPWIAVLPLFDTAEAGRPGASPMPGDSVMPPGPWYDAIPEPPVPLTIRRASRQRERPEPRS
jgi:hypothetical protein